MSEAFLNLLPQWLPNVLAQRLTYKSLALLVPQAAAAVVVFGH